MSLQVLAQDMASRGRGPDTMLVHMAPKEVAGLQALARAHGGSLTVNPQTGLPEAGFLKNLLPTLIGAGLMAATGGTAAPLIAGLSNATTIGLGVGALQTARTGSLSKGIMAGLGAYGGAGLTGSLLGAGESALGAANAASPTVGPVAAPVATPAVGGADLYADLAQANAVMPEPALLTPAATPAGVVVGNPIAPHSPWGGPTMSTLNTDTGAYTLDPYGRFPSAAVPVPPNGAYTVAPMGADPAIAPVTAAPAPITPPPVATPTPAAPAAPDLGQYANAKDRLLQAQAVESPAYAREFSLGEKSKAGLEALGKTPKDFLTKQNLKYAAGALAPMVFQEPKSVNAPSDSEQYRYTYSPGREMPPTRTGDVGEFRYFQPSYTRLAAGGGLMDLPVERMSDRNQAEEFAASGGQMYAAGGISHLGDYSDGGRLLRGPGDGVSDSIPASIADKRPARLADGEFVVPARIVSELGNGSTEAGARKLYAMMDRVQKNRNKTVGKGKVAVDSRSEKLLPA